MGEGKILKRGGDLQKYNVHTESTRWNISRALAYWDASGVKLYLAQVVSLRLGNPRVSSRGVTPSVCQFESFANRVR